MIRLVCPECGCPVDAEVTMAGHRMRCPDCKSVVPVPRLAMRVSRFKSAWVIVPIAGFGLVGLLLTVLVFLGASPPDRLPGIPDPPEVKSHGPGEKRPFDAVDLYAAFEADPDAVIARWKDKPITVKGVLDQWTMPATGVIGVYLRHERGSSRFRQNKIMLFFRRNPPGSKSDYPGFDLHVDRFGELVAPWGDVMTVTGDLRADREENVLVIDNCRLE